MHRSLQTLTFLVLTLLLAGCAGMITGMGPSSSGGLSHWKPPKETSDAIFLPLNFSIRTKQPEELRDRMHTLTEDRIREFLSIGIRILSQNYAFDADAWKISLDRYRNLPDQGPAPLGLQPPVTELDYRLYAHVESPPSRNLSISDATPDEKALISLDSHQSDRYEYRAAIDASLTATVRKEIKDAVFFDVSLWLRVRRKSRYAADQHFDSFASLNEKAIANLRRQIEEQLFESYARVFESLGLSVERKRY